MKLGKQKAGITTPCFQCAIFYIPTKEYALNDGRCSFRREISSSNVIGLFLAECTAKGLRCFCTQQ
jgi:hypothetical protein